MFNSTKISESPRLQRNNSFNNVNETANGISRSFLLPKITSTPMQSPSLNRREIGNMRPSLPIPRSPKRYSLSDIATPPRYTNNRDLNRSGFAQNVSGPLLASTRYNVNVSTYLDSKSPGLAGRIVQYHEQAERSLPTHQPKYGSPGILPIVHLFKKKPPMLKQSPRKVTVRIASPEYSRTNSEEHNRMLMEGLVRSNSTSRGFATPQNDVSTRSVLDALKEISRKRIHASEEYDLNEDSGKRLRTEDFNSIDSNKRCRDDSPLLETSPSPTKPVPKKLCVYDEYAASCSSTDHLLSKNDKRTIAKPDYSTKRKSISTITEYDNPKETKQVKLINAETQTVTSDDKLNDTASISDKDLSSEDENKTENEADKSDKKNLNTSPVIIFDNEPLERIRRNRLAALMGTLSGKQTILSPKPDLAAKLSLEPIEKTAADKSPEKPLVSILSMPNKVSPKSDKHVTFCLPNTTSSSSIISTAVSSSISLPASSTITQTSAALVTPLISTSVSDVSSTSTLTAKSTLSRDFAAPTPPTSPVMFDIPVSSHVDSAINSAAPTFSIPVSKTSSSSNVISSSSTLSFTTTTNITKENPSMFSLAATKPITVTNSINPLVVKPASTTTSSGFTFGSLVTTTTASQLPISSPPKIGGFKFDLHKPMTTTPVTSTLPPFSFSSPSQTTSSNATKPVLQTTTTTSATTFPTLGNNVNNTAGGFSFGAKTTAQTVPLLSSTITTSSNMFGSSASVSSSNAFSTNLQTTSASVTFGTAVTSSSSFLGSGTFKFGTSSTENKSPAYNSPANKTTPVFNPPAVPSFGGSSSNNPVFGAASSVQSFGTNVMSTSASPFGSTVVSTSVSPFGNNKIATTMTSTSASFGGNIVSSSATPMFGAVTTTAAPIFGSTTTASSFPSTTGFTNKSPSFKFGGTNNNATTTSNSVFGGASKSTFGTVSSSSSPFTAQLSTQPKFAAPTTTVAFGPITNVGAFNTPASSAPLFGSKSSPFKSTTNTFGNPAPQNSKPLFPSVASPFGIPTTTTTAPAFGTGTTTPAFGTTATTTVSAFGSSTAATSAFGQPNTFSTKTTTGGIFGSGGSAFGTSASATPAFGTVTTTTPSFGTNSAPAFGSTTNVFGGTAVSSVAPFGSGFNSNTSPAFGTPATTTNTSTFGTTSTPAFGSGTSAFGSSGGSAFTPTSNSTFGSGGPSAFGASSTPNIFGATGGNNANSGFGTNAAQAFGKPQPTQNSFGSTASTSFGSSASSTFGSQPQSSTPFGQSAPTTQSAVFAFGSGAASKSPGSFSFGSSEPPKPSFNFTGGAANSTSGFSFGSNAQASVAHPAFGAAGASASSGPGMFSIGAGSSTGNRQRAHLRAKRRT